MATEQPKPVKRLQNHLTQGNLWMYILVLLKGKKELYAYVLDEMIEKKFGFRPNKIMLYLVLYKLESEGLIESRFVERRKYYVIRKKGSEALANGKKILTKTMKDLEK